MFHRTFSVLQSLLYVFPIATTKLLKYIAYTNLFNTFKHLAVFGFLNDSWKERKASFLRSLKSISDQKTMWRCRCWTNKYKRNFKVLNGKYLQYERRMPKWNPDLQFIFLNENSVEAWFINSRKDHSLNFFSLYLNFKARWRCRQDLAPTVLYRHYS